MYKPAPEDLKNSKNNNRYARGTDRPCQTEKARVVLGDDLIKLNPEEINDTTFAMLLDVT